VGRELLNHAGTGFGGEADADPVGAGTDVDASGVRVLHGQSFDPGGLPLMKGFALGFGPGLVSAVGMGFLGAGRRGGGRFASGGRCRHGRTPPKRKGEGIGGHALRPCAEESAGIRSLLQTGTARSRETSTEAIRKYRRDAILFGTAVTLGP
jgi:hypothetical protein